MSSTHTGQTLYQSRPPWASFACHINGLEVYNHEGLGLTLDHVIGFLQGEYANSIQNVSEGADLKAIAAKSDHMVIWKGSRVAAVLIPDPEGLPQFVVTRFP